MRRLLLTILPLSFLVSPLRAGELEFPEPAKEEASALGASTLVARYPFANRSASTVTLTRFETECSCMTLETRDRKMRFEPGETGELIATFQIGNHTGTVEKSIRVWTDEDRVAPSRTLKLKVTVPALVLIDAKTLQWAIGSADGPKSTRIRFEGDKPVHPTGISSSDPNFVPSFKTLEDGRSYEISVTCTSAQRKALGVIRMRTDSAIEAQRSVQLFAMVK